MVENARRKASLKPGGGDLRIELEGASMALQVPPENLLDLERALGKLGRESPERARVVLPSHIERVVGYGGMAVVFEALQDHPRRIVALKLLC